MLQQLPTTITIIVHVHKIDVNIFATMETLIYTVMQLMDFPRLNQISSQILTVFINGCHHVFSFCTPLLMKVFEKNDD